MEKSKWLVVLVLLGLISLSPATIINVPSDYPTIQEAVNAASSGDTIQVAAGTYREQIYINKNLTLLGAGNTAGGDTSFIVPPTAGMSQPFLPTRQERPIVGVDSMGTNVIFDGFTVDGEGRANASTHARMTGI